MTVSASVPYVYYTASASQTTFAYTWLVLASTEIAVYVDDVETSAYSVTGIGNSAGGTVVMNTGLAAGQEVVIRRVTARTQPTDLQVGGAFLADTVEALFDRVTLLTQDLRELLTLAPGFAPTVLEAFRTALLPHPAALKVLGFNAAATGWSLYDTALLTVTPDPVSGLTWAKATQTLTASNGAAVLTASALFPAGVIGLGVTARGVTSFGTGNGLTALNLGDANAVDAWGGSLSRLSTLVSNAGQWRRAPFFMVPTSLDVWLTAVDGTFDATGQCKVTAHYLTVTPDA